MYICMLRIHGHVYAVTPACNHVCMSICTCMRLCFPFLQPILSDIAAYGETVEKTRAMGDSLKGESDEEEKMKIDTRLESLQAQFAELQQTAKDRMKGTYVFTVTLSCCIRFPDCLVV